MNFNLADVNQVDGKCIAAGGALRQCIVFSHPQFDITFDLTVSSLDPYPNDGTRFSALFDFPSVERLDFTRNGTIQTRFGLKTIGTYAFGALLHVEVLLDFVTGRWKISLNGTTLDDQPFASNYIDLVSLRFGLGTQATGGDAAIDNIRVVAVPEQTTGSLLLAGLALSTANRAYRRRC